MDRQNYLHRFDHARPGGFHLKLMLVAGSTWIWVAYGVTIIGFIIPSLKQEFNGSSSALGFLAGIGMLGMLFGAITAGTLADHFGRRRVLTVIMFYQAVLFGLTAAADTYNMLLLLRFLLGMGLGAALPVAGTLVSEFSPVRIRGMLMVLLNTFWALGASLSALVGYLLVIPLGWRPAMLFGLLAALSGLLTQFLLPESFRYLQAKGRVDEILRESGRIRLEQDPDAPEAITAQDDAGDAEDKGKTPDGFWTRKYAKVSASLWLLWIALNFLYQGVYVWLPTLLAGPDGTVAKPYLVTLFISLGQLPGTFLAAWLADRYSRRNLLILSQGLVGVSTLVFAFSQATSWVLVFGFLIMMFNGMAMGLGHPFTTELYPTHIRGRANGWASGIGRLGGVAAPLAVGYVLQSGGSMLVIFGMLAAAPLATMFLLAGLPRETTGKSLEEIHKFTAE